MRFVGLTLCLLASSLGARAESVEDRMAALEDRVKVLEEALRNQTPTNSADTTLAEAPELLSIEDRPANNGRIALFESK